MTILFDGFDDIHTLGVFTYPLTGEMPNQIDFITPG